MINHNSVIKNHLKKDKNFKNLDFIKEIIVDKSNSNFTLKSFEYICLGFFETFMSNFYSPDRFQVRILAHESINGRAFKIGSAYYALLHHGTYS